MGFPGSLLLNGADIYNAHVTKRFPLGTRGYTRDGRVFRYAKCGATALTPGMLCEAEAVDSNSVALTVADSTDWAVPTTSSTVFHISSDVTATANYFADGYFMVTAGTQTADNGQYVQIESHTAGGVAGATGAVYVYPYDGETLSVALSTSNTVSLIQNPYQKVIVSPDAAPTGPAVGVCPTSVTAAYYFWLQTWGPACCFVSDTWDTGHGVYNASATGTRAGECFAVATLEIDKGSAVVGIAQYIGTDGYAGCAFLTMAP